MTKQEAEQLDSILAGDPWHIQKRLKEFRRTATIQEKEEPKGNKTSQQLKAAWLYITQKLTQLNDSGLDQRTVLKPEINIPWTKEAFHDKIWIPVQKAMYGTDSMKDLKKDQLEPIHKVIERELGEKHGVEYVPFPNDEARHLEEAGGYKGRETEVEYPEYNEAPTF